MLEYKHKYYPSVEELPDSDETPVDNELQDLIPGLLKAILAMVWSDRWDWFFGVDMGIYYDPELPPYIPDGFLSLGCDRIYDENLRPSYAIWEDELPIMMLEVVSQHYRNEYSTKKDNYAELGALYYVIYHPYRRRKVHLEVYRLVNGEYVLQPGNPVWLPEIGLGIGCERGTYQGITREWMYWYDEQGQRYLIPEERAQEAEQRAQEAELRRQEADRQAQEAELRAQEAELRTQQEQQRAQEAELRTQQEQQRAQEAELRTQQEQQRAQEAELRTQRLIEQLRSLGIDPNDP